MYRDVTESPDTLGGPQIVALNGSPHRNGNTATLMRWVLEGCRAAGADVTWLHVVDYDIRYCQGCFACLRTGICPLDDDYLDIRERLLAAEGIVVGSPVYEGHATAQLNTLINRLTLLNLYTDTFKEQRTIGVATSGVAPTLGVARGLADYFGQRFGVIGAKTVTLAKGYQSLAEVHPARLPGRARRLGQRFATKLAAPKTVRIPSLMELWIAILRHFVIRRLVENNPDQFAGVLRIWDEEGWR